MPNTPLAKKLPGRPFRRAGLVPFVALACLLSASRASAEEPYAAPAPDPTPETAPPVPVTAPIEPATPTPTPTEPATPSPDSLSASRPEPGVPPTPSPTPTAAPTPTAPPEPPPPPPKPPEPSEPTLVGYSVGIHGGYSLPFGAANGGGDNGGGNLNNIISGVVPIGFDVGYFVTPRLYIGAYLTYGFATIQSAEGSVCGNDPDTTCNAVLYRFGAVAEWHFMPEKQWDPWVTGGLGWDVLNVELTNDIDGSVAESSSLNGPLMTLGGGLDLKPGTFFGIGPYGELAVGHFLATNGFDLHGYLTFGLRMRTNL